MAGLGFLAHCLPALGEEWAWGLFCRHSNSWSEQGGEGGLGEDERDNAHLNGLAVWCLFSLPQAKKQSKLHFELQFPSAAFPLCFLSLSLFFLPPKVCRGD